MSTYTINDRVVDALFSEGPQAGYRAVPLVVQTLFGLVEHADDTPTDTLLRLLDALGLNTADKVRDFFDRDTW